MITTFPDCASIITGTKLSYVDTLLANKFEDGLSRQASQYRRRLMQYQVQYVTCDLCAFKKWVTDDLCHGARWFMWVDNTCLDPVLRRARIQGGEVTYTELNKQHSHHQIDMIIEAWE